MITSKTELVTPRMAEEWLDKHYNRVQEGKYRQRHIYQMTLRKYISDMRSGNWKESPVPIIFDSNGDLADGQHRLEAIKQSGESITMRIEYGWPPEVIDYVDRGKSRTVADQLHLHGTKNALVVSSSVSSIVRVAYRGMSPSISYAACISVLDKFGMRKHVDAIMLHTSRMRVIGGRTLGPLAWYHSYAPKKALEFARQLIDLDTEKGSGTQIYAKYMRDRSPDSQDAAVKMICACLRIWDDNEKKEYVKAGPESVDWLASRNPKLKENITDMFGLISSGLRRVEIVKKVKPPTKK